jgi:hypothetical protein
MDLHLYDTKCRDTTRRDTLEKERKLKVVLQVKKHENNEVLVKLQITKENINMEKHNKDLEKIKVKKDFLHAILM